MDVTVKKNESKLQTIAIIGGVCFFVGRACFVEGMAPVGAALILTLIMQGIVRLEDWQKAIISGSVVVTIQSVWYIVDESVCSISEVLLNGALAAVFCSIFQVMSGMWGRRKLPVSDDMIILSVSAMIMLMVIGAGIPWLLLPAGILMVVISGYTGGIAEGLISSFASGTLLYICGQNPVQIMWIMLFSVIAGVFRNSSRWLSGTVISLTAALTGCFQALPAGLVLMFLPEIFMVRLEAAVRSLKTYNDNENEKNLRELSLLFSSLDNPRSRLAYEFKAMSQLYNKKEEPVFVKRRRQQQAAVAGYAGSDERCGDYCLWENLPDGKFAVALSDGMGKGEHAAQESHLAATSVIKMLKAGLDAEMVLKLLNVILMVDTGQERFSTMDLGILDPETDEMYFYKIGAAPTIIKRKEKTEILTAPAMPMGVMDGNISCVSTIVRPGDLVIMMTDGIVDSKREDLEMDWLKRVLTQIKSKNPQTVCDLIIKEASENYMNREKDDMTVVSFRVR